MNSGLNCSCVFVVLVYVIAAVLIVMFGISDLNKDFSYTFQPDIDISNRYLILAQKEGKEKPFAFTTIRDFDDQLKDYEQVPDLKIEVS